MSGQWFFHKKSRRERHTVRGDVTNHYSLDISNFGWTILNLAHRPFWAAHRVARNSPAAGLELRRDAGTQKGKPYAGRQAKPEPSEAGPVWRGGATE